MLRLSSREQDNIDLGQASREQRAILQYTCLHHWRRPNVVPDITNAAAAVAAAARSVYVHVDFQLIIPSSFPFAQRQHCFLFFILLFTQLKHRVDKQATAPFTFHHFIISSAGGILRSSRRRLATSASQERRSCPLTTPYLPTHLTCLLSRFQSRFQRRFFGYWISRLFLK